MLLINKISNCDSKSNRWFRRRTKRVVLKLTTSNVKKRTAKKSLMRRPTKKNTLMGKRIWVRTMANTVLKMTPTTQTPNGKMSSIPIRRTTTRTARIIMPIHAPLIIKVRRRISNSMQSSKNSTLSRRPSSTSSSTHRLSRCKNQTPMLSSSSAWLTCWFSSTTANQLATSVRTTQTSPSC